MSTLQARLNRRLALIGLLGTLLVGGIVWAIWHYTVAAAATQTMSSMRGSYQAKLEALRQDWQREAQHLRAEIEFLRIGELPTPQRRARLLALLNAQAEWLPFRALMFVDAHGIPFLTRGCTAILQQALDLMHLQATDSALSRSHCADGEYVYSVTRMPLWLGDAGRGGVILAAALDNATMRRLAEGGDLVYLLYEGRIMASSAGRVHLDDPIDPHPRSEARRDGMIQVVLPLDPQAQEDAFLLVVRRPPDSLFSVRDVLVGTTSIAAAVLALIWFGVGRDVRRHVRDIDLVSQASDRFQRDFRQSPDWYIPFSRLLQREDEIGQLTRILDRLMDEALQRQKEHAAYQQTLDLLDDVVIELDSQGRLRNVSNAWSRFTGRGAEVQGQKLAEFFHPEDTAVLDGFLDMLSSGRKQTVMARLRLAGPEGQERWAELRLARCPEGVTLRGVLRDITQSYLQEQRITHMAMHDALTGLPNRVLLEDRIQVALHSAQRHGHKVAVGFIDLDHFKEVNDSLGHKTGDQVLVALSKRLRRHLRASDTLARWGGDEFVVLLPEMPDSAAIQEVADKLRQAIDTPIQVEDVDYNLTFSAGFAVFPDDAESSETLLSQADRAMFYAKSQGRNNVQFYSEMPQKGYGRKDLYIQQRLAAAIRDKRIIPHYQPQVRASDGRVLGVEVLARWFDPDMGWISPATFIPMAENLGLIRPLGEVIWHRALHDMAALRDFDLSCAINISKRQLFIPLFADKLIEDVEAHGLRPERVVLEITESIALLDVEYGIYRLRQLHEAGFRLAIDDFGVGYSSLSVLHQIPIHELKIDQSFIHRLHEPQGRKVVQVIVGLAASMGLRTTAEGVEDQATADLLREMGVEVLQGFHFARAMPAEELSAWLAANAAGLASQAARR
ncbi:MAG: putative bifunctional diguanylate cyclase/phosphodiesterase [Thiobacillaceae bacterium]